MSLTYVHKISQASLCFGLFAVSFLSFQSIARAQSASPKPQQQAASDEVTERREDEKLRLAREQFENDKRIANGRLDLDRRRIEIDERFFNRNLGTLITALLSLAAIIVSLSQVIVAYLSKKKEIEVAGIAKNSELRTLALNNQRDWNLKAVEFVATNQELIFGTDRGRRERITSVMLATFPPEITRALFEKLEVSAGTTEEKEVWTAGQEAATKLLLVRVDGVYAAVDKKDKYTTFLRFFPDGTVVYGSVDGTDLNAVDIARWLVPGLRNLPQGSLEMAQTTDPGKFLIKGSEINFSVTSSDGTVDYHGTVKGDSLILDFHSHINDNRGSQAFYFVSTPSGDDKVR